MNMVHKIMTLTAIGLNVNNGDVVKVIIGCLLDVFIDEEQRKEYLNYILPDGRVEIEIDGKEVYFYITQKMCASESLGALFLHPEDFANEIAGIIDIGGLNINCSYFTNGKIIPQNCFTSKYGKLEVIKKLKYALNREFDAVFDDFDVEVYLKKGYVTNHEEKTRELVGKIMQDNVKSIINSCKEKMMPCGLVWWIM